MLFRATAIAPRGKRLIVTVFVGQIDADNLQVVEMIAINITDDADLLNFILACKDFASATILEKSTVWRTRFLARYDQPIIEGPYEFRVAYQLREMVLRKFPSFRDIGGAQTTVALEVLRDIVLGKSLTVTEDYWGREFELTSTFIHQSNAKCYLTAETYNDLPSKKCTRSRNLDTISSPISAPYMAEFLSSPFFAYETGAYGKPNRLFAALQIFFSHLLLHPRSKFAATVRASREYYDLSIIYLYDVPLKTIYQRQPPQPEGFEPHQDLKLDLNALLHIRNFWHGHLAREVTRLYADAVTTYGEMALTLAERDHAPRQWDRPIQQTSEILPNWFGHYSCTHTTPRKIVDIEEHQTCAEDWIHQYGINGVHPLTLDIATTTLPERGWWPPIFSTVPILGSTIPPAGTDSGHMYIRGVAPFLSPTTHPDLYVAYLALRVRGVIHPLPDQREIPGWRRIVMVLWTPTSRYLLAVLDENSPDDDDPFGQDEPIPALQAPNMGADQQGGAGQAGGQGQTQNASPGQPQDQGQTQNQAPATEPTPQEIEKAMKEELQGREELKGPLGPALLTRDFIAEMEDNLHPPEELAWEDIGYAWVYEGVIIPGGKIMMGRYWRCGLPTLVNGFEQGDGADRGPWVFWC